MIIGLMGPMGSGKDTVAQILKKWNFQKLAVADRLKDIVAQLFHWPREYLEGTTEETRKWRETVDEWWAKRLGMSMLTPRFVLQTLGTQAIRTNFHPDLLIASMERELDKLIEQNINVVITDLRFHNEIDMVRSKGGKIIKITRNDSDAKSSHVSETSFLSEKPDYIISNDGSLEDLENTIEQMINTLNIF